MINFIFFIAILICGLVLYTLFLLVVLIIGYLIMVPIVFICGRIRNLLLKKLARRQLKYITEKKYKYYLLLMLYICMGGRLRTKVQVDLLKLAKNSSWHEKIFLSYIRNNCWDSYYDVCVYDTSWFSKQAKKILIEDVEYKKLFQKCEDILKKTEKKNKIINKILSFLD